MAEDKANSKILDSRVQFWCAKFGVDPGPRYTALWEGRAVAFTRRRRDGKLVVSHKIKPEELE